MTDTLDPNINLPQEPVKHIPKIPPKISDSGYRFIKVRPRAKTPHEPRWQRERNYAADDPILQAWLEHWHSFEVHETHYEGNGNYGVLCSSECIVVDLDSKELIEEVLPLEPQKTGFVSENTLPATYCVKSGSGRGIHAYYRTKNAIPCKLLNPQDPAQSFGDIQAAGKMVVGPDSAHPSGGLYEPINDLPIAEVDFELVKSVFSKYLKQDPPAPPPAPAKKSRYSSTPLSIDIPIERIIYPLHPEKRGTNEIQGEHPVHGSTGKKNLSINTQKGTWFCFRCQSGGGPAEAIAVVHGLINCQDSHPGCLRGETFKTVLEIAEDDYGWARPIKQAPEKLDILKIHHDTPDDQFDIYEPLPPAHALTLPHDLPPEKYVLVNAYPRIGKSHWSELQAIKHKTANIIANTHSVIEHHLRIFRENKEPQQTATHLEGKNRCCNRANEGGNRSCKSCGFYPYTEDPADRGRFLAQVQDFLFEEAIVTADEIPDEFCKYFFLKESAKISDYVYTVTENLDEVLGDEYRQRHLTVIDEDTCFANFFPRSAELCEFTRLQTKHHVRNHLESKWRGIQRWKDYIVNGKKRPKGKKTILRMIEILEQIRMVLEIRDTDAFNPTKVLEQLNAIDTTVPDPDDITKADLLVAVRRWELSDTFSNFAEALLYPYKEMRFAWQGYNTMKLRMIADESIRMRELPDTKTILIGSTRAELLLKTLNTPKQIATVSIDEFPYSNYFLVVVVKNQKNLKDPAASKKSFKDNILVALNKINSANDTTRYPVLVLTGSKKEQARVMEEIGGIGKGSSNENETGQRWNHLGGNINVFYQNSVISRGVDVPFYKSMFVVSSDFASPYWSARYEVAIRDKNEDDAKYSEAVRDAITIDETTNSVLRITPTRNTLDEVPRLIIIQERDMWKIKPAVIKEATVVEVTTDHLAKNLKELLDVVGRAELLPSRAGVDEDGNNEMHQYQTIKFCEPEILRDRPVKEKCGHLAKILESVEETEPWRRRISPAVVNKSEASTIEFLRKRGDKTIRRGALQKWMAGQHKNMSLVIAGDILTSMRKRGLIRIFGFGLDAKVLLPSSEFDTKTTSVVGS